MVIFSVSSGTTSCAGEGRKSLTLINLPIGISELIVFFFIINLPLSPISGSKYPDFLLTVNKPDCEDFTAYLTYTEKSFFAFTMFGINVDLPLCILEDASSGNKINAMLLNVN